ncbi:hypothetical protein GCM10017771_55580 [Streptomyces capitiformicae]|uniref:Uncharacterized protein n=1 Tax=Streptomyces capitiformicae TaxID=2014920 RepID=A0A918Z4P5_9ACTN|nr:hypothetical protein GCM10017771_55580 [Streptomyces capitiformicae]
MVVVTSGAPTAGGGLGMVTGPPGGSWMCPVVSLGMPACCGVEGCGCPGAPTKPEVGGGTEPGGAGGVGGATGTGGFAGAGPGCAPGGTEAGCPWWFAVGDHGVAGSCPGRWGGGSGAPTACCIRCHSVSYSHIDTGRQGLSTPPLPNGTVPGRRLVNGRGQPEVPKWP